VFSNLDHVTTFLLTHYKPQFFKILNSYTIFGCLTYTMSVFLKILQFRGMQVLEYDEWDMLSLKCGIKRLCGLSVH